MSQQNNLVGQTLGQYEVVELIGEGGMATVYKAWQPSLRRYVALKVLSPDLANDAEFVKRFRQEAVSAANLKQTHIVTIHDVGTEDGYHYIAMEFIEGNSLEERIRSGQAFSLEQVIDIVAQVGAALDYAHQRGFIHRDIKPANILIDTSGRAVLTDFGIVKAMGGSGVTSPLTQAGTIFGTPQYMSPEQVKDEPLDRRSDLYSLGVVCYEMLSGQVPFDGTTTHSILYAQVNNPPPPLREFSGLDVPTQVEAVVNKMLAKEREARYDSAGAFARDLAQAVAGVWPASFGGQTAVVGGMGGSTAVIGGTPPGMQAPTVRPPAGPPTPPGTAWQPSGPPTPSGTAWQPSGPSTPPGTVWQPSGPSTPPGTVLQPAGPPTPVPAYAPARRSRWPWVLGGVAAVGVVLVLAAVLVSLLLPDVGNPLEWVGLGNRVERLLEDGQAAMDAGNYDEAITTYEQVLEEEADNVEALREIGNAYAAQEQWPQAAGWYERWAQVAPGDVEALRGTGDAYAAQEQWPQAAGWYERWAQVVPDDAEALRKVGEAYETQEQWQQAADWYEKLTQVVPDDGTAFLALGRARYNLGEHERAVAAYERGTELGADSADLDAHLGLAYYSLDRYDKAVEHLQDVVGQNPEDFELQRALGVSLYAQGQSEQAVAHLNKALSLGADQPGDELMGVYYALGGCYSWKQEYEQAISFYEQAQEVDPEGKAVWADEAHANLDEAYSQLALQVMNDARLDLGFSNIVTEGDETYAVAQTGQMARIVGPVWVVDGPGEESQALVVEGRTTNLCQYPSMELGAIGDAPMGWTPSNLTALAQTEDMARYGAYSVRFEVDDVGSTAFAASPVDDVDLSKDYTISAWVFVESYTDGVLELRLQRVDSFDRLVKAQADTSKVGQWQRISATYAGDGTGMVPARLKIQSTADSTLVAYVDGVQMEQSAVASSYCDGDQGPGYSWSDTPHASISTRAATAVNLDDHVDLTSGVDTLSFRVVAQMPYDADGIWPESLNNTVFDAWGPDNNSRILVRYYASEDKFKVQVNAADPCLDSSLQTFKAGDWIELIVTLDFSNDSYRLYMNGDLDTEDTVPLAAPTLVDWVLGDFYNASGRIGGFAFSEYTVFDSVLTTEEVQALYRADSSASE